MMKLLKTKIAMLPLAFITSLSAQTEPIGKDGIATVIDLFSQKPIVAIGETHGHVQLYTFLTELVQTEGFYRNVNDIFIESGNSLYQSTLDDYISGKTVKHDDLKLVWMNTTQSPVDPWGADVYFKLLETVRNLNKHLPKKHQIRVIAADPPISWVDVNTHEEYVTARGSREAYYAELVINETLEKNRKALLICGGAHFGNHSPSKTKINQRISIKYPNSVTVILAKSGIWKGTEREEQNLNWTPGTITEVKNTWIGLHPGPRRILRVMPSNQKPDESSSSITENQKTTSPSQTYKRQDYFDYLLYLGPEDQIKYGKIDALSYRSEKLWLELNRRSKIRFNNELTKESRQTGILRPRAYN